MSRGRCRRKNSRKKTWDWEEKTRKGTSDKGNWQRRRKAVTVKEVNSITLCCSSEDIPFIWLPRFSFLCIKYRFPGDVSTSCFSPSHLTFTLALRKCWESYNVHPQLRLHVSSVSVLPAVNSFLLPPLRPQLSGFHLLLVFNPIREQSINFNSITHTVRCINLSSFCAIPHVSFSHFHFVWGNFSYTIPHKKYKMNFVLILT